MKHIRNKLKRRYYDYSGLHIKSEMDVPEWALFERDKAFDLADVTIVLKIAGNKPQPGDKVLPVVDAHSYRFHIPGTGVYRVHHGREITVMPAPGAKARELRLFLLGSAWGALCYQRGLLALHASVVQVEGRVIAFCGEPGSGKSSVAAWLVARGHRLVGDDLCRFDVAAGHARVYPSAPRLKLWRDALAALGWSNKGLERDHFRMDKFHLPWRGDLGTASLRKPLCAMPPVPVRAIYLLQWGAPGLKRLTGLNALRRLVAAATYRGDLLEPMGQVATHWERCAGLARCVPVWEFSRPRDWSAMDEAMRLLQTY